MAKLAGRWITVTLDDATPTARAITSDVQSIDIPMEFDEIDVTGFSDGSKNSIPGMPGFNVEIVGKFNPTASTGLYTVINDIVGDYLGHTLTVAIGQNKAPTTDDPEFEGEFWCPKMSIRATPSGGVELVASLRVYGIVAPAWGTVSA
jgi:hypothetical protein